MDGSIVQSLTQEPDGPEASSKIYDKTENFSDGSLMDIQSENAVWDLQDSSGDFQKKPGHQIKN